MRLAFRRLVNLVPRRGLTLLGADSPDAAALAPVRKSRVQTFGTRRGAGLACDARLRRVGSRRPFGWLHQGNDRGRLRRRRCSASTTCGTPWRPLPSARVWHRRRDAARGAAEFRGVKRRLEVVGAGAGLSVYDDFAHHPTAVAETLAALRAAEPEPPHLGHLRAALRLVVPPRVSGRFRARVSAAPTRS